MLPPVTAEANKPNQNAYIIRGTSYRIPTVPLQITRATLALFSGTGVISSFTYACFYYNEMIPLSNSVSLGLYGTNITVTAAAIVLFAASCILPKKEESTPNKFLQPQLPEYFYLQSIEKENPALIPLLNELCEVDEEGGRREYSIDRLKEIIQQLEQAQGLKYLDSIPTCFKGPRGLPFLSQFDSPCCTPLQYWAEKGDLEAVKILINNGAHDHFSGKNDYDYITSGLFLAALRGHVKIVEFLLENGSRVDIAFSNNCILQSFLPKLVFNFAELMTITSEEEYFEQTLECLRLILTKLRKQNPKHLKLQLRIPVDEKLNIYDYWLETKEEFDNTDIQKIQYWESIRKLLVEFGAKEKNAYTIEELETKSFNVGGRFTLHSISTLK